MNKLIEKILHLGKKESYKDDTVLLSLDFPPNYKKIQRRIDLTDLKPVFTYGNTIHNPHRVFIDDTLKAHEFTHIRQQAGNPRKWWRRFLKDKKFRLDQEVEAYREQYKVGMQINRDRNARVRFLMYLARELSGQMYGNIISTQEAARLIENRGSHA